MTELISNSTHETEAFAETLAKTLNQSDMLALFGGMGAGKTAFVRGLARGLGFTGETSSPTFAIVHEYRGGRLPLFHFDMYRVAGRDDLESCAFFEYLDAGGVTVTEWSENIEAALPENAVRVYFEICGEDKRIIRI